LGSPTGAGVIYGASGGVMESALRTAYEKITNKKLPKVEFEQMRGLEGIKKASVKINGRKIRTAVVNGTGNARVVLEELKKNPKLYDYVEVMACFGGCIGGGGQPVPANSKIRKERAEGLYRIDTKKEVRSAHENPVIKEVYKEFLNNKEIIHNICHTKYSQKKREVKFKK
jgi:NADH-quinone oxidoreductase subunit G